MFRILQTGNSLPFSWPVDPNAEFEPGQIGQLTTFGQNIVCTVSDGSAPIGIIDDIKTRAFYAPSIDEVIIAGPIAGVMSQGKLVTPNDVKAELANAYIQPNSFISNPVDVELKNVNGMITFLAGTPLNFDADGDGIPDSIRTVVSYSYQVPNVIGDDSTSGNGRVSIWAMRVLGETDQFSTSVRYPINAPLFVGPDGKFTTRQYNEHYPAPAIVTAPPTSIMGSLEFLWL